MAGGGGGSGGGPGLAGALHDPHSLGSYSQLLLSDDLEDDHLDPEACFNFTAPSLVSDHQNSCVTPKMLCFGNDPYNGQGCDVFLDDIATRITQQSGGITCSDSSSAASTTSQTPSMTILPTNVTSLSNSNKKKNVSAATGVINNCSPVGPAVGNSGIPNGAPATPSGKQRNCKRPKTVADDSTYPNQTTTTPRHAKAKKENLGERVIALQQLVSPFGKTDTASVLHEAMGYIKFLQDQVQVLCSPYLQRLPSSGSEHLAEKAGEGGSNTGKDLRSKGLCLVPMELTSHVADSNGADFWSPAMVSKLSSSSSSPSTRQ